MIKKKNRKGLKMGQQPYIDIHMPEKFMKVTKYQITPGKCKLKQDTTHTYYKAFYLIYSRSDRIYNTK